MSMKDMGWREGLERPTEGRERLLVPSFAPSRPGSILSVSNLRGVLPLLGTAQIHTLALDSGLTHVIRGTGEHHCGCWRKLPTAEHEFSPTWARVWKFVTALSAGYCI